MLKGWSLMGDALAHSIVPGVAGAYILGFPFAIGAFFSGILAAFGMQFVKQHTRLREDAVIGLVFTSLFALGLLMASIWPTSVSVQTIMLGNILAISDEDVVQVAVIAAVSLGILLLKWKDLMVTFFDESHARGEGPDGERDACKIGDHDTRQHGVRNGVAHQRPALEHHVAGENCRRHRDQRRDDERHLHEGKLERRQEVDHPSSAPVSSAAAERRRAASNPCLGAKTNAIRKMSVCSTTIMPPVAPLR